MFGRFGVVADRGYPSMPIFTEIIGYFGPLTDPRKAMIRGSFDGDKCYLTNHELRVLSAELMSCAEWLEWRLREAMSQEENKATGGIE